MRAPWLGPLAIATIVSTCVVSCAPDARDATTRQQTNEALSDEPGPTNQTLRRTVPLSLEDRAAWRAALDWPASCEEAFESSRAGQDGGLVIRALAPRVSLVEVLCAAGAYQPSHVYVKYDEQGASPISTLLEFPVFLSADETVPQASLETEIWGESSDRNTGNSSRVTIGDAPCSSYLTYTCDG